MVTVHEAAPAKRPTMLAGVVPLSQHGRRAAALLAVAAMLYLWDLDVSGWGNDYYAAAVQSGTLDSTAFLFGSLDPQNVISVDKPPLALWLMGLSARIFGFRPWALMLPEAVAGVVTVGLLVAAVRRLAGSYAGLIAGAVLAVTPSVVLVARYDNPDALLLLLVVAAAYTTIRALGDDRARWVIGTGVLLGLGLLTKSLQTFLIVPGLLAGYVHAGLGSFGHRLRHISITVVATVSTASGWLVPATLWPKDHRPYFGGSSDDSAMQQAFGFNGVGRLVGSATGLTGAGTDRLVSPAVGGQIAWLLPAAVVILTVGLWWTRTAERRDDIRTGLILWGGWVLVTGIVLSGMQGIFHSYYTSEMGPGIAALIGIGTRLLWLRRDDTVARVVLIGLLGGTATWAFVLLNRTSEFVPWLRWVVLGAGISAIAHLVLQARDGRVPRLPTALVAAATAVAVLGGPAAYAVATVATAHSGSGPKAGPQATRAVSTQPSPELMAALRGSGTTWSAAVAGGRSAAELELAGVGPVMVVGGYAGADPVPSLARFQHEVAAGRIHWFVGDGGRRGVGNRIGRWVASRFAARRVGDHSIYDLTRGIGTR